jgi:S1-C subfamily serine protease
MKQLGKGVTLALAVLALVCGLAAAEEEPKPWLGVYLDRVQAQEDEEGIASRPGGVGVRAVVVDSPAADAGLRARDVVLAVEGAPVFTAQELIASIQRSGPGDWVTVSIQRGRSERDLTVRLVEKPSGEKFKVREGWIGTETIDLPPLLRQHFGAPEDAGVMVSRVFEGSPAESAGILVGDVIFDIDGERVYTRGRYQRRVRGGGVGNTLEITLSRNWAEMTVDARVEERPTERLLEMERARIHREDQEKRERKEGMRKARGGSSEGDDRLQRSDR